MRFPTIFVLFLTSDDGAVSTSPANPSTAEKTFRTVYETRRELPLNDVGAGLSRLQFYPTPIPRKFAPKIVGAVLKVSYMHMQYKLLLYIYLFSLSRWRCHATLFRLQITFSQIDSTVLGALPPDLRREVMDQLEARQRERRGSIRSSSSSSSSPSSSSFPSRHARASARAGQQLESVPSPQAGARARVGQQLAVDSPTGGPAESAAPAVGHNRVAGHNRARTAAVHNNRLEVIREGFDLAAVREGSARSQQVRLGSWRGEKGDDFRVREREWTDEMDVSDVLFYFPWRFFCSLDPVDFSGFRVPVDYGVFSAIFFVVVCLHGLFRRDPIDVCCVLVGFCCVNLDFCRVP